MNLLPVRVGRLRGTFRSQVAFFAVPLGMRLDPQNLHGLANVMITEAIRQANQLVRTDPDEAYRILKERLDDLRGNTDLDAAALAIAAGLVPAFGDALPFPLEPAEPLVRFRCPGCRVRYRVSGRRAGEAIACRRCGGPITIPAQSSEGPPA